MVTFQAIEYFFVSTWLWGMTWGIYHIPVNVFIMIALLKFVGGFKLIPSILITFFSKVFSLLLYFLIVVFFVFIFKFQFVIPKNSDLQLINVLRECIFLGIIYSVFQSIFFLIVNKFYKLDVRFMLVVSFASNVISALLGYKFLDMS